MTTYILYNPKAGKGNINDDIKKISALYEDEVECIDVTTLENLPDFVLQKNENEAIVICGGDGTINKFVNMVDTDSIKCDILYYPAGTGNDFLSDLGKTALECPISIKEYFKDLPMVQINGVDYKFINGVGYGIDGYCCEVGDALKASSDKPVNYTAIAIKGLLFHYKPTGATVTVDGKEYRFKKVWIAPTMKGRYYGGGMIPTPDQSRNDPDGKLSVMVFHDTGKISTLAIFPSIFKGKHVNHKKAVTVYSGHEITVQFDEPRPLQVDGETILGVTEYTAFSKVSAKV
ncbi:MAG: diacylglycerol kinase family protein [Ruminococcaceae bacterium]|nr:diacylglycerol kinase family protein [Oscillospiraceae bacterium]